MCKSLTEALDAKSDQNPRPRHGPSAHPAARQSHPSVPLCPAAPSVMPRSTGSAAPPLNTIAADHSSQSPRYPRPHQVIFLLLTLSHPSLNRPAQPLSLILPASQSVPALSVPIALHAARNIHARLTAGPNVWRGELFAARRCQCGWGEVLWSFHGRRPWDIERRTSADDGTICSTSPSSLERSAPQSYDFLSTESSNHFIAAS